MAHKTKYNEIWKGLTSLEHITKFHHLEILKIEEKIRP